MGSGRVCAVQDGTTAHRGRSRKMGVTMTMETR